MRNHRDPHRENVENILAICLAIVTMQHTEKSPSASHALRKSAWNACCCFLSRTPKELGKDPQAHKSPRLQEVKVRTMPAGHKKIMFRWTKKLLREGHHSNG